MIALRFTQQQLVKTLGNLAIIGLSLTLVIILQESRLKPSEQTIDAKKYQELEQVEKLQLDVIKGFPSLGFDNLLADWLYLRFIQYFGDGDARNHTGYLLSADYFEIIVKHDPRFVNALLKLDAVTSIFAGEPEKSVKFLDQSLKVTPPKLEGPLIAPYYLWIYKAVNELLFLGDVEAAKQSYTMAANWAETYEDETSQRIAANKRNTVQFLATNPTSKIPQIGAWTSVLSGAADKKTQERAIAEIQALGGEIIITPEGTLRVRVPEWVD
ncbi:MAG TPA: hypothetical protein DCF68_09250 [Cyanothece sp. UBA12306]|nr:hypothetical protein [Cyanothece sp. UBA12306]